jgi:hypothetical protein
VEIVTLFADRKPELPAQVRAVFESQLKSNRHIVRADDHDLDLALDGVNWIERL